MADDQETEERQDEQGSEEQGSEEQSVAASRAKEKADAWDSAREKIKKMEEQDEVPTDLEEWPDDEAKYVTFGGGEGDHGYDEGPETKLGPSSLERHDDGRVTIEGEEVDNPDDYKADEPVQAAVDTPMPAKGSSTDVDHPDESGSGSDEESDSGSDDEPDSGSDDESRE